MQTTDEELERMGKTMENTNRSPNIICRKYKWVNLKLYLRIDVADFTGVPKSHLSTKSFVYFFSF